MKPLRHPLNLSISMKLTLSFIGVAFLGSVLLYLPISLRPGVSVTYFESLLTAVSLVCVSGLAAVPVHATYSPLGQVLCLVLVQLGGLGIITIINFLLMMLNRKVTLKDQFLFSASFNMTRHDHFRSFLRAIMRVTLMNELIGTAFLSLDFVPRFGWYKGLFNAAFISVSAFTNAGFHPFEQAHSLEDFAGQPLVLMTVMYLIVAGGIGFPVWFELIQRTKNLLRCKPHSFRLAFKSLSLHSRLVLEMTVILICLGFVLIYWQEGSNPATLGTMPAVDRVLNALFSSITARTAGFTTVDYIQLRPYTKFITMSLTLIGGAPGGTAGGIKVTTFAILALLFRSELRSYSQVVYRRRVIPLKLVKQSLVVVIFFMALYIIGFSALVIAHPEVNGMDILFEVSSAKGTSGISLGVTEQLGTFGRWVTLILMVGGRVGPTTLLLAILQRKGTDIRYANANLLIG